MQCWGSIYVPKEWLVYEIEVKACRVVHILSPKTKMRNLPLDIIPCALNHYLANQSPIFFFFDYYWYYYYSCVTLVFFARNICVGYRTSRRRLQKGCACSAFGDVGYCLIGENDHSKSMSYKAQELPFHSCFHFKQSDASKNDLLIGTTILNVLDAQNDGQPWLAILKDSNMLEHPPKLLRVHPWSQVWNGRRSCGI